LAAAALAALLAATPCQSEEDAVGGETLGPLSPIVVSLVSQQAIVPVLGSDGRYHVLYEFEMLNTLGAPADLCSVEVLDAEPGKTLLALSADDNRRDRVLILNLGFDSKDSIPSELTHRFQVSGADPFNKQPEQFDPPVLAPPLEGPGWLASDGCRGQTGQINALVGLEAKIQGAERFAIDWIKIDADGQIFTGDKTKNWVG